jgi:hypothetical protein
MDNELIPFEEPIDDLENFEIERMPEPTLEKVRWGRKSTEYAFSKRLEEAMDLIVYKNLTQKEFRVTYSKLYNVGQNTADKVFRKVKEILRERSLIKQDEIIANQLQRYMDLLNAALEDGNKRVARECLWDISRIQGLDQRKIDISSGGEPISIKINLSNNPNDFNIIKD